MARLLSATFGKLGRPVAIAATFSAFMLAAPASARDGAFYVGGDFGALNVGEIESDVGQTSDAVKVEHDLGFDAGVFAGYDFGAVRVEAEGSYKRASLDSYTTSIRLPFDPAAFPTQGTASGSTSTLSAMVNGYVDLGNEDGTSFFIGGGIGAARIETDYRNNSSTIPFIGGTSKWGLAWQAIAGVRHAISDNVDVSAKYRFFNTEQSDLIAFNGAQTAFHLRSHSLLVGLTFNFGK